MNKKIYKAAKRLLHFTKGKVDFESIVEYIGSHNVKVVFFNTDAGDREVFRYGLQDKTSKAPAFTFCGAARIIFVDNTISYEDKVYTLLHEIGHIVLGHIGDGKLCVRNKVFIDIEADTFAYTVLNFTYNISPIKALSVCALAVIVVLAFLFSLGIYGSSLTEDFAMHDLSVQNIVDETEAEDKEEITNYVYVTPHGTKYHSFGCRYIKGKECTKYSVKNATKKYTPCSVCNQ